MWLPFLALLLPQSWWMMAKMVSDEFNTAINAWVPRISDMFEGHATRQDAHVVPSRAL